MQKTCAQKVVAAYLLGASPPTFHPRLLPSISMGVNACLLHLGLESRGPGIDPFRAGGPKWGRKWPKHGFWPPGKWEKMARKMEKNSPKMVGKWNFGPFFSFPCHVSPIFQVRPPKSIFRRHFRPHFGPEAQNGSIPGPRGSQPWSSVGATHTSPHRTDQYLCTTFLGRPLKST